jgi:DNA polymerase-1
MDGAHVLGKMQRNGLCVDVDYCQHWDRQLEKQINRLKERMDTYPEMKLWKRTYGSKFKISSNPQLTDILFNKLKLDPPKFTDSGKPSADDETLALIDLPLARDLSEVRKLEKVKTTYFESFLRETVDGIMHPFFSLNFVRTFRSSSANPNFQNFPNRNEEQAKLVRRAIRPRKGRRLLGADYSKLEVHAASWYHKDPTMLEYLNDEDKDMHRDMAAEIYLLDVDDVSGRARYAAKNGFVFPEFYGSYWRSCAHTLWKYIDELKLKTEKEGIPLKEHLRRKGIKTYEQFEKHVERVEDNFWNRRFRDYTQWKEDLVDFYYKHGYVDQLSGFRCYGPIAKNKIINYPVQGVAFHCLLWSAVQIQKILEQERMQTLLVGQIHDELVADVVPEEMDDFLCIMNDVMCSKIKHHWPWIITPLSIEVKATEVDGNWYEKKKVKIVL